MGKGSLLTPIYLQFEQRTKKRRKMQTNVTSWPLGFSVSRWNSQSLERETERINGSEWTD